MKTMEEIHDMHAKACAEAGAIQYRIKIMGIELDAKNELIKQLNIEASQVMEAAKKAEEQESAPKLEPDLNA